MTVGGGIATTAEIVSTDVRYRSGSKDIWLLSDHEPDIRQIYGGFLPPCYMRIAQERLKVTDFHSNPHAHHDTNGYMRARVESLRLGDRDLARLERSCDGLQPASTIRLEDGVRLRKEKTGCVVYTGYHNGFFANESGAGILDAVALRGCARVEEVVRDCEARGGAAEATLLFLKRLILMEIVRRVPSAA